MQSKILSAFEDPSGNHLSAIRKTIEFESIIWQSWNRHLKYQSMKKTLMSVQMVFQLPKVLILPLILNLYLQGYIRMSDNDWKNILGNYCILSDF